MMEVKHPKANKKIMAVMTFFAIFVPMHEIFSKEGTSQKNCCMRKLQKVNEKVLEVYMPPPMPPLNQEAVAGYTQPFLFMMAS